MPVVCLPSTEHWSLSGAGTRLWFAVWACPSSRESENIANVRKMFLVLLEGKKLYLDCLCYSKVFVLFKGGLKLFYSRVIRVMECY